MEQSEDFSALPLEERLSHTSWRAKQSAYDELSLLFAKATENSEFAKWYDALTSSVEESNAIVMASSLPCLLAFLKNCGGVAEKMALRLRGAVCSSLIERGLTAGKAGAKAAASDALLEFVYLDSALPIITQLLRVATTHRQPKVIAASTHCVRTILNTFGTRQEDTHAILPTIPRLLSHPDKDVREATKMLAIDISGWMGGDGWMAGKMAELKGVQASELQTAIAAKCQQGRPVPLRWLKKEKPAAMAIDAGNDMQQSGRDNQGTDNGAADDNANEDVDNVAKEWENAMAIDVLSALSPSLDQISTQARSSNWKERKEALSALLPSLQVTKMMQGGCHYGPLISVLTERISKDVNVQVVSLACQCLNHLILGLRTGLKVNKNEILTCLLERCKEKNKSVLEHLRKCLYSLALHCRSSETGRVDGLIEFMEASKQMGLNAKNPQIRAETLGCCLAQTTSLDISNRANTTGAISKKQAKMLTCALIPCMSDGNAQVRDNCSALLSWVVAAGGEEMIVNSFLNADARLDRVKIDKIVDGARKLKADCTGNSSAAKSESKTSTSAGKKVATSSNIDPSNPKHTNNPFVDNNNTGNPTDSAKTPSASSSATARPSINGISFACTDAEAMQAFTSNPSYAPLIAALSSTSWKERLEAIQQLSQQLSSRSSSSDGSRSINKEMVVRLCAQVPSWNESNFQVILAMLDLISTHCLAVGGDGGTESDYMIALALVRSCTDKIGDTKLQSRITQLFQECLLLLGKDGFGWMLQCLVEAEVGAGLLKCRSPRVIIATLGWINEALESGQSGLGEDESGSDEAVAKNAVAQIIITFTEHPNNAIREAALKCTRTLCRCINLTSTQRLLLESTLAARLSGAHRAAVEQAIADASALPRILPKNTAKDTRNACNPDALAMDIDDGTTNHNISSRNSGNNPVVDISNMLNPMLPQLGHPDWKTRKAAIDNLAQLVHEQALASSLAINEDCEFLAVLADRFCDSNKMLIVSALDLCTLFVQSLSGRGDGTSRISENHLRQIVVPITACLADNKAQIRQAAINCLQACANAANGLAHILPLIIPQFLSVNHGGAAASIIAQNPNLKRELWTWLASNYSNHLDDSHQHTQRLQLGATNSTIASEDQRALLLASFGALQDRSADVRKVASAFVATCARLWGESFVVQSCQQQVAGNCGSADCLASVKQICANANALIASNLGNVINKNNGTATNLNNATNNGQPAAKIFIGAHSNSIALNWTFDTPTPTHYQQLAACMHGCLEARIIDGLFSSNFKDALLAMDALLVAISSNRDTMNANVNEYFRENVDLLLKYLSIRLYDGNPTMLSKSYELLGGLLARLDAENARLTEAEAMSIIPHYIRRSGEHECRWEALKSRIPTIYRQFCLLYPASKIWGSLCEGLGVGGRIKGQRCLMGALQECHRIISRNGTVVMQPAKHIPLIAGLLNASANGGSAAVKSATLDLLIQIWALMGGEGGGGDGRVLLQSCLSKDDLELFNERLKYKSNANDGTDHTLVGAGGMSTPRKNNTAMDIDAGTHHTPTTSPYPTSRRPRLGPSHHTPTTSGRAVMGAQDGEDEEGENIPQVFSLDPNIVSADAHTNIFTSSTPQRTMPPPSFKEECRLGDDVNGVMATPSLPASLQYAHPNSSSNHMEPYSDHAATAAMQPLNTTLDTLIQRLGQCTDLESISIVQKLEVYIADAPSLGGRKDSLMCMLCVRLHELSSGFEEGAGIDGAAASVSEESQLKSRLARYLLNAQVNMVSNRKEIASLLSQPTVQLLIKECLLVLTSGRIAAIDGDGTLSKQSNLVLVRTLANANSTACFTSLINCLLGSFTLKGNGSRRPAASTGSAALGDHGNASSSNDKYTEYVLKCCWKKTREIKSDIEAGSLQSSRLLKDIHVFFHTISPVEWKMRASKDLPHADYPLRTLKACLQEIVKVEGEKVVPLVVEGLPRDSFVVSYVRAMLLAMGLDASGLDDDSNVGAAGGMVSNSEPASTNRLDRDQLEARLLDITTRICSKPNTRNGLADLHTLILENPGASEHIDGYLRGLGTFFYKYIQRNLDVYQRELATAQSSFFDSQGRKAKLESMQRQIFEGGQCSQDGGNENTPAPTTNSPIRNRLESPIAKSLMSHNTNTGNSSNIVDGAAELSLGGDGKRRDSSSIVSLKERLAKLRQENQSQ